MTSTEGREELEDAAHGSADLPGVTVESYNLEIKDAAGFVGDSANTAGFFEILAQLNAIEPDPLETSEAGPTKDEVDALLHEGNLQQAALIFSATEEFAQRLLEVLRRYMRLKDWRGVERIAVGGGFRHSRVGELAIGRTNLLLRQEHFATELTAIHHHPDEAGLIGCAHLAPAWVLSEFGCILGVDIGGSKIRCGIVSLEQNSSPDLAKAHVMEQELWHYFDDDPDRDQAVRGLADMLRALADHAQGRKLPLAPFIGIGCPGIIDDDGTIRRGAQNLPGNWEGRRFNLVACVKQSIPAIGERPPVVVLHNDAVVQGLSELPFMQDVERWGVVTIGTGLGNASFRNKRSEPARNGAA